MKENMRLDSPDFPGCWFTVKKIEGKMIYIEESMGSIKHNRLIPIIKKMGLDGLNSDRQIASDHLFKDNSWFITEDGDFSCKIRIKNVHIADRLIDFYLGYVLELEELLESNDNSDSLRVLRAIQEKLTYSTRAWNNDILKAQKEIEKSITEINTRIDKLITSIEKNQMHQDITDYLNCSREDSQK